MSWTFIIKAAIEIVANITGISGYLAQRAQKKQAQNEADAMPLNVKDEVDYFK